jgi:AraC family transcriptional regulator of arabinose operon
MKERTPDLLTAVDTISPGSFKRGSRYTTWRPKGSGDHLLIYTKSGKGYCETKTGELISLKSGSIALWEPDAWQAYGTDQELGTWSILWAHFKPRPHWLAWLRWSERAPGLRLLQLAQPQSIQLEKALENTLSLSRTSLPFATERAMNAFERALLEIQSAGEEHAASRWDPRIRSIVEWLATLPRKDHECNALARRCGLSPSRFAHLFREETGTTPQQMLEKNRMDVAGQLLLKTRLDIQEIAHEVGYDDALYFSRRFKRFHGKSPSEYRLTDAGLDSTQ